MSKRGASFIRILASRYERKYDDQSSAEATNNEICPSAVEILHPVTPSWNFSDGCGGGRGRAVVGVVTVGRGEN